MISGLVKIRETAVVKITKLTGMYNTSTLLEIFQSALTASIFMPRSLTSLKGAYEF